MESTGFGFLLVDVVFFACIITVLFSQEINETFDLFGKHCSNKKQQVIDTLSKWRFDCWSGRDRFCKSDDWSRNKSY